ncbi:hypothetical protein WJX74_002315 [Apatococcus lobatus]|uniref:Uncharacterized protein n=1 Tax=Apatococcus lobatus TaxID=904363 RepID=A0AAW1RL55_9CHLO
MPKWHTVVHLRVSADVPCATIAPTATTTTFSLNKPFSANPIWASILAAINLLTSTGHSRKPESVICSWFMLPCIGSRPDANRSNENEQSEHRRQGLDYYT